MLELRGISKRFGAVQALTGVDLEVYAGEVVGLVGDNGAGKSTLIKCIAGINLIDDGPDLVRGPAGDHSRPRTTRSALGISTVYQDLALCDNLDVVANLYLGREQADRHPRRGRAARRGGDGEARHRGAARPLGLDPQRAHADRLALGRAAPIGGGGALGDVELQAGDPGRADRRAGVAQTRQVLDLIRRLREQGPGGDRHQPQPGRCVLGRGPHRGAAPGPQCGHLRRARRHSREQVVAAITGAEFGTLMRVADDRARAVTGGPSA